MIEDFIEYFRAVTADRRANPTEDLASAIANARIDGGLLSEMEVNSFFTQLLPRLHSIELVGEYKFSPTTFVGGLKQLPVRYEMT